MIKKIISYIFTISLIIFIVGLVYFGYSFAMAFSYGTKDFMFNPDLVKHIVEISFIITFLTFNLLRA